MIELARQRRLASALLAGALVVGGCTGKSTQMAGSDAAAGAGGAPAIASGGAPGAGGGATGAGGAGWAATGGVGGGAAARSTLDIHWIDVEGGAATLLVAPTGESLLVDAGFPGNDDRDVDRVLAALATAGVTRLDHVITTHYHTDHVGGVTALASRFTVGRFIDHGPTVEGGSLFSGYMTAIAGRTRVIARPGDRFQLGEVEILILTAAGEVIDPPPTGSGANALCAGAAMMDERPTDENPQSVGFVARFGSFDFLDLGDLTWQVEDRLVCPTNRVGMVDLYQVSHHGLGISNSPQLVHAVAPVVAVMNNGATKGGETAAFDVLRTSPGLEALYQLHRSMNTDAAHNSEEALIANVSTSPDGAYGLRAQVARDGTFTITNGRTGQGRTFQAR